MKAPFQYDPETVRRILQSPSDFSFQKESEITSISTASGMVEPGSLFVPLRGNRDGHEFILDALKKGASYFLCEKDHPILEKLSSEQRSKAIQVKDTLLALGKLATFHRSRFNPILIAVTGSSGKTTTKEILSSCLSPLEEGLLVTEKNYNNEIGVPFTLFKINSKTRYVVCEMGMNHAGEISRLTKMARPDYSLITTIGTAHIELLGSRKGIAKAKAEVLEGMNKGGVLFYPETGEYKNFLKRRCLRFGIKFKSVPLKRRIEILETNREGFKISFLNSILDWSLPGIKLLENLALCISLLEEVGTPTEWIQNGIENFRAGDKRLNLQVGNYKILNDTYNANRESMLSSLEACSQISGEEGFYAVLGDMKEVGNYSRKFHNEIGSFAAGLKNCKGVFLFGTEFSHALKSFRKKANQGLLSFSFPGDEEGLKNLVDTIRKEVPPGAYLLAKASRGMRLERAVEELNSKTNGS
ncbi:UDP-N-acetylmuramoyl-tripeptide--D-alanyl-D-alanine ligase [Leptospira selangorensis]|uniref:UDP-N-acetylmuramoyl-tripeptide--D-alanyl-D-alanine ligase n=1 Tax=Leptospira selangorensis TaxID=2484982 RepID=A0A5F2BX12_9LEPT|nr:UDP-N-acetylmuramoyl-tripeptide--D-alanyl-D-alanine ligase [Leptospira selangorensis]TGM11976.1 UDP-N-acetylmuramoyl-tripeptide--D-alanyl-D-alanine ligase [Leptospira selangorensis]TGM15163.1 UDP-N-acetylmuramoyl-tripeptide--D-alanyl-D-alanine ligase [Leptospira selangorensis]